MATLSSGPQLPTSLSGDAHETAFVLQSSEDQVWRRSLERRQNLHRAFRAPEQQVLERLLLEAQLTDTLRSRIHAQARQFVEGLRAPSKPDSIIDALLNEYSLSTHEGVTLMCLAEALLRVPDKFSADALIRDKLLAGNWSISRRQRNPWFVGLCRSGLRAGQWVLREDDAAFWQVWLRQLAEPIIRASVRTGMHAIGRHFVLGDGIESALKRAASSQRKARREGRIEYRYSFDMLGEGARTQADADRYFKRYCEAIKAIGAQANKQRKLYEREGISIKLSALHPRYEISQQSRVMSELGPRLLQLARLARQRGIPLTVDAEEAERLDLSLDVMERVLQDGSLAGWDGFGLAVQAYQKRALDLVDWVLALARKVRCKINVRLVKGAYWDSEIKWSQEQGLTDYPVFTRKAATDVSYQACVRKLLANREYLYPQFATHNAYTVATILAMDDECTALTPRQGYEFQRLHGMGEALYQQVMKCEPVACRVYAPVGHYADLLAYLVRRLLENGANSSFVNRVLDENVATERLLEDPVEVMQAFTLKRNGVIPLPEDLFRHESTAGDEARHLLGSARKNSAGLDFSDRLTLSHLQQQLKDWWQQAQVQGMEATEGEAVEADSPAGQWQLNPADRRQRVGWVPLDTVESLHEKLDMIAAGAETWASRPVKERARLLRLLADSLEQHRVAIMGLCVKEAGKTLPDALAEVREAVDFCRYYADQAELTLRRPGIRSRGLVVCISPWNFPLAIFLGQVSAALVAGNCVLAKPAQQTRCIALKVKQLMQECGFPESAMQLALLPGEALGDSIREDDRIQAVLFTGAVATARHLAGLLSERRGTSVPLVAETGGQNVMIVDSTALLEQVVDDVVVSAFQSAGQRCSALRVVFVQEEIADDLIRMLQWAMQELVVGDPALLATDIGPVIDEPARIRLQRHSEFLNSFSKESQCYELPRSIRQRVVSDTGEGSDARAFTAAKNGSTSNAWARLLYQCQIDTDLSHGDYWPPQLFELSGIEVLAEEVFGPVLHLVRYRASELDAVIDQVNSLGYGLTLGVHSRNETLAETIASRAKVGNVYINRNMIGAVVGAQPFGGRGLSGTGPKAGGPHYLLRLVHLSLDELGAVPEWDRLGELDRLQADGSCCVEGPLWASRMVVCRQAINELLGWRDTWVQEMLSEALPQIRQLMAWIGRGALNVRSLPGPTGEHNCLQLEPRGRVAIVVSESVRLSQAVVDGFAALLSGNEVVFVTDTAHQEHLQALMQCWLTPKVTPALQLELKPMSELQCLCLDPVVQAVMVVASDDLVETVNRWLVHREGGMIPVIVSDSLRQRLLRLTCEKTITINTAAIGGNAALLNQS